MTVGTLASPAANPQAFLGSGDNRLIRKVCACAECRIRNSFWQGRAAVAGEDIRETCDFIGKAAKTVAVHTRQVRGGDTVVAAAVLRALLALPKLYPGCAQALASVYPPFTFRLPSASAPFTEPPCVVSCGLLSHYGPAAGARPRWPTSPLYTFVRLCHFSARMSLTGKQSLWTLPILPTVA